MKERQVFGGLGTRKLLLAVMVFFLFTMQCQVFTASAIGSEDDVASALAHAEGVVASAYKATSDAEQAGADVSNIVVKLNDAADELSGAEIAFRQQDFNLTIELSSVCSQIAEEARIEADQLRLEALGLRDIDFWFRLLVSFLAVVAVGFGSFFAWRLFRERYYRRVLKMKPEAVSGES